MKVIEAHLKRIAKINKCIYSGNTGNAKELGAKIGCCERIIYEYLNYMREKLADSGIDIYYNHTEQTYQYTCKGNFDLTWTWTLAS